MKSCAIVLAFVCTLFFLAPVANANKVGGIPSDTYNFLLGVAVGLELEISPQTFNACTADVNLTVTDFTQGFSDIDQGIRKLSKDLVDQGLQDFGLGVQAIADAFSACGVDTIAADVKALGAELSQGVSGVIDVIVEEALNIWHHKEDVTSAFKQTISDFQSANYYGSGQGVGEILGILLQD